MVYSWFFGHRGSVMKLTMFLCLVIGITLVGCRAKGKLSVTSENGKRLLTSPSTNTTALPSTTPTLIPTLTPISPAANRTAKFTLSPTTQKPTWTLTPTEPKIATPTHLLTIIPKPHEAEQCLKVAPKLPLNVVLKGSIVLQNNDTTQVVLRDMGKSIQKTLLGENTNGKNFVTSPNRQWLAFIKTQKLKQNIDTWLSLMSADGYEQTVIPWENGWFSIASWLDNQRLIIRGTGNTRTARFIFNPFTSELQELPEDPNDIYTKWPVPDWDGLGITSYDPFLNYRAYVNRNYELVLENLNSHKIITHIIVPIWDAVPRWSPDGQQFIIVDSACCGVPGGWELHSIGLDGHKRQLTDLVAHKIGNTYIPYYQWSPDGRYIAFWFSTVIGQEYNVTMGILDVANLAVLNYCITTNYYRPIIWTPDSMQIVTEISDDLDGNPSRTVLVDIQQGWAAQIAENMTPLAWMSEP